MKGHSEKISDLEWSREGDLLASASRDGTVRIWNTELGKLCSKLSGHDSEVSSLSWSGDHLLVTGSRDQTIRVWNRAGKEVKRVNHRAAIEKIACSPTRPLVATACRDGSLNVRNVDSGKAVAQLSPGGRVRSIEWTADGLLLSASSRSQVLVWSTDNWQLVRSFDFGANVSSAVFVHGHHMIAIGGDRTGVAILDANDGSPIVELEGHAEGVNFLCAARQGILATQSGIAGETILWDVNTWDRITSIRTSRYRSQSAAFAFHPQRCQLAMLPRSDSTSIQISG